METLSKQDERRIMSALERAVSLTNSGTHPNDAITKIASEERLTAPIVQRMVEAYNVSKTLSHMKTAAGPERAASFPLADSEAILSSMYPRQAVSPAQKAASVYTHADYSHEERINFNKAAAERIPLPFEKSAKSYSSDPSILAHKAFDVRKKFEKVAAEARSQVRQSFYRMNELAKQAGSYFRYASHKPFSEVEEKIWGEFGEVGKSAMDLVAWAGNVKEKRAEARPDHQVVFGSDEPYGSIVRLIKEARAFHAATSEAVDAEVKLAEYKKVSNTELPHEKVAQKEAKLLDDVLGDYISPFDSGSTKAANFDIAKTLEGLGSDLSSVAGTGMSALGLNSMDPDAAKRKALSEVVDPVHEATLASIKTKALLNDFMANDPILSGYDPKEVSSAYNVIAQLAPSVAQQPGLMRGLLRRVLQQEGVIEPHEAEQMGKLESNLRGFTGEQLPRPQTML